jgi:signal transduction histidine kinase
MRGLIPRTIRWQLIVGTALLQCLLVIGVFGYVYHEQRNTLRHRTIERVSYQVHLFSSVMSLGFQRQSLAGIQRVMDEMLVMPTVHAVRITDLAGNPIASASRGGHTESLALTSTERAVLGHPFLPTVFDDGARGLVGIDRIEEDGTPVALAWVFPDSSQDQVDLSSLLQSALLFALLAIAANALFSLLLARSVTRPLRALVRGTKLLARDPEQPGIFPLQTNSTNEAGELTYSFNTMVAALNEQRSGLNDTLALLDSLLANAPIGFAFFDHKLRFVRVNQFLAEMDSLSISRHLGRSVFDIFPGQMAHLLADAVESVFSTGSPVRDLELRMELDGGPENTRTWLANFYPVLTLNEKPQSSMNTLVEDGAKPPLAPAQPQINLVGAVFVDATDRKLAESMLRRTEKLAATGRLAASIAHEINNPLEAVTNLLYLLHQQPLDPEALKYADMAQREIARVSHITQQTLRFYRQSSKPVKTSVSELLDSVLGLYQGRLNSTRVEVVQRYRGNPELMAFSGEMRQMFANFIGNALDAMHKGGRLVLSVRAGRAWNEEGISGVRVVVADTGTGMTSAVRKRIFDAFFTTKEATGTGLGLWISSEIIAKHRGTIRVRSIAEADANGRGRSGTVFMVFFPEDGVLRESWEDPREQQAGVGADA